VPTELARDAGKELGLLRGQVLTNHSSWAALCICLRERPGDIGALLEIVGVTHRQVKPFDACADAYSVYEDACTRRRAQR
jgi:hypothetical protein